MKKFYARYNPYGVNLTDSSIGWHLLRFCQKDFRDRFVENNQFQASNNYKNCAVAISASEAYKLMRADKSAMGWCYTDLAENAEEWN